MQNFPESNPITLRNSEALKVPEMSKLDNGQSEYPIQKSYQQSRSTF